MQCRGAVIRVISPSAVPGQALVAEAGGMGAPTVGLEKLDAFETEPALMAHQAAGTCPARPPSTESQR